MGNIGDWGTLLGGLAQGVGAWQQSKIGNKLFKLQLDDYNEEKKRRALAQARLDTAADRAFSGAGANNALPTY